MAIAIGLFHGFDYIFLHFALGSLIFRLFILPAAGAIENVAFLYKQTRFLFLLTLITSTIYMLLAAQDMAESWAPADLWTVMGSTHFGHLWCLRIVFLIFLFLGFKKFSTGQFRNLLLILLTLTLPLISALSGHAASQEHGLWWKVLASWLHSVAVGVWTGGLLSLFFWLDTILRDDLPSTGASYKVVKRFSHFAMASTGIIVTTGLLMAYVLGVSFLHPWESLYGKLLIGKIILFSLTLAAASVNQFIHLKKWNSSNELAFIGGVKREVMLELILVLGVFFIVGFLTRSALPGM